ncbi:histidine kinase [Patiriisocius marinistellae]|uniref:histidine kinase n=2 Tax=Patiriisocius marinistellae TaxID=2494560 RepID=A0A5J4G0Q9_9FLAO|nr:histidine kinase [Patiriisocius marinistellae]
MCYGQAITKDSISLVKQYKTNANEAIFRFDFEEAVKNINLANNLVVNINDDDLKADVMVTNTMLQYYLQNYNTAQIINEKAIKIILASNNIKKLPNIYVLNGLINTRLEKFTVAEDNFDKADSIFEIINDEKEKSPILIGRGLLEFKKGNSKAAVNYYNAGISDYKNGNNKYFEAFSYVNKAEALIKIYNEDNDIQHLNQAKSIINEASVIIDSLNYKKLKIESYKVKSEIAIIEKKFNDALLFFNKYTTKNDSLNLVFINSISATNNNELNVGALHKRIENYEENLVEIEKSEKFNQVTNGMSIAIIAILSLLTLSLYKNNNLRAKANNLLQDKNTELQLAKEKAEKASLAKAQFLSTITHELRTPLYAVTGLTHLLMEESPKEHQKEHLNSLKFSGEYLLSLINNILDLNKLEANKVEVEKTSFNLKKRINDVLVALKKSADDKKTKLVFDFNDSIPEIFLGDPVKLSQILINLIGNSVKFTQNGVVNVRVKKIDQRGRIVKLKFEIEDNGVGISKKKQKSIFETFSQGSLQINRKFGGTGLGLSIVKNLLELMNSKIELESQLGKGSKFWFNLDIEALEDNEIEANNEITKLKIEDSFFKDKNVLVVEDNKINQMITKKILEKNHMICQVADNGMTAIELVKNNNFDIVLMDIHMPGISGIEATQKIRLFDEQLPIIALTAVTIDENLDTFFKAGFNEIIPKPFKPEEFFEKIHSSLKNRQLQN